MQLTVLAALPDQRLTTVNLQLTATVMPDIVYEPEGLTFFPDSPVQQVAFSPGRMKEFALKRVYCTHRAFEARLLPDGVHVEVAYHADALSEEVPEIYLMVETTSLSEPICRIPLTAAVRGNGG